MKKYLQPTVWFLLLLACVCCIEQFGEAVGESKGRQQSGVQVLGPAASPEGR
jgi:hypothetical protein